MHGLPTGISSRPKCPCAKLSSVRSGTRMQLSGAKPAQCLANNNYRFRPPFKRQQITRCAANNGAQEYIEEKEFRIEQTSFGAILTPIGLGLLTYGFGAFFQLLPGSDISSIMLIYGFPISLLGFALSYAQLKPVPCKSTQEALNVRDAQMTDIQKQVREDVTRYRYGDEQHLDEALTRIFMFGRPQGIPRRLTPELVGVREETKEGRYSLILEFKTKKEMTLEMWTERQSKIQTFFGPGITADIESPSEGRVDVYLATDGSGAGRGGPQQKDVLPPLVPGAKPRSSR